MAVGGGVAKGGVTTAWCEGAGGVGDEISDAMPRGAGVMSSEGENGRWQEIKSYS